MRRPPKISDSLLTGKKPQAFTIIELLIVIGLLGALAALLLSNLNFDRTDILDSSIVEKELSDIQRVFQNFYADCLPNQNDLTLITKYGLAILMEYDGYLHGDDSWSFDEGWNPAKGKGWRGPYISSEGSIKININFNSNPGQQEDNSSTVEIPVIETPYINDDDGVSGDYYRVIADQTGDIITELWVVFPSHSGTLPSNPKDPNSYEYKRRLLLKD